MWNRVKNLTVSGALMSTAMLLTKVLPVAANHTASHSVSDVSSSSGIALFANDSATLLNNQTLSDSVENYDRPLSADLALLLMIAAITWTAIRIGASRNTRLSIFNTENRTPRTETVDDSMRFGSTGQTHGRNTKR